MEIWVHRNGQYAGRFSESAIRETVADGSLSAAAQTIVRPAASRPPEGETLWSPVMAIIGSLFLSPAFGGFIVWRNWLIMKRRRRALMAAPWFWIGFIVLGLAFYSPNGLTLLIWIVYTVAWIAFSAFPQIRYVQTTVKREKTRWGFPLVAALILWGIGFAAFEIVSSQRKTTLEPSPEQPKTTQVSQSHDRVFTAEELRDIYKSSVLEVRTTWQEKRSTF